MHTVHTHTPTVIVQFSVFDIFWSPLGASAADVMGGHVTNSVSGPSLFSSEVSSIICAQVLHSLSSASPQHPADRCYLRCYYPSSNKTTLLSSCFGLSGITSTEWFLFFFFLFRSSASNDSNLPKQIAWDGRFCIRRIVEWKEKVAVKFKKE